MKHIITLGADPEIFVKNENEIVSAEGLTKGGTKQNPKPITNLGHYIQEDGIMFEYNIPPCSNVDEWIKNHNVCLDYLNNLAKINNLSLSKAVSSEINPIYLDTPQASTFGCEPDFNVYTRSVNQAPENNTNLRCAGGHVAIGYENPNVETSEKIVLMFDIFLTLPSLFKDNDTRRRELYGKAGSFRFKDWGVECRALSNFWIQSEEEMIWVYKQTLKAVNKVLNNECDELILKYSENVKKAIDEYDLNLASFLINEINQIEKNNLIEK